MPYELIWNDRCYQTRFSGDVTAAELLAYARQVGSDPRFDDARVGITDYTDVRRHDVRPEDIRLINALANAHRLSNPRLLHITVATEPSMLALAARWMETHPMPDLIAVVPTVAEALEWARRHLHRLDSLPGRHVRALRAPAFGSERPVMQAPSGPPSEPETARPGSRV